MNILVLTPLYKLSGRESLQRNTEVIHHFVKYWVKEPDINVRVVNTYLNPGRNISSLLKKGELKNYRTPYDYEVDGVKVHLTEVQQIPFQGKLWNFQNKKIKDAINSVVQDFKPDVVVAHFPVRYTGVIDQVCPGVPKIAVMHYTDLRISRKCPYQKTAIGDKFDVVFTRSKSLLRECRKLLVNHLDDFVVNSGVPYAESRRKANIRFASDKPVKLLYVGKLITRKHLDYVIKAIGTLNKNSKIELAVIGEGPQKQDYINLANACGVQTQVNFIGQLTREEVYRCMGDADIFIMPSVQETLGLVYLEAMMNGCITVGTEGEGIDGIIENGRNGFLVEPNSEESVHNTLKEILSLSDEEVQKISAAATETGQEFNEPDMAKRYLDKIKQTVQEVNKN
mgnify:CR=1 FL=1